MPEQTQDRSLPERLRRSKPVTTAATATKAALRHYGSLTHPYRPVPDFLIIGAKRGGTTSLWKYLQEHPGVLPNFPAPENPKGTYFLDEGFQRGTAWYRSHFPSSAARSWHERQLGYRPVVGEATPYYLYHPLAPRRARALVPEALVIALLRNPIERSFSHYKERRNHTEALPFADAIAAEEERIRGEHERILADPTYVSFAHRHQTYLDQGRYADMLQRWSDAYPADQLLVVTSEEFYRDPQALVDDITDRLGLPRHRLLHPEPHNDEPSAAMAPELRAEIAERLAPDIRRVEEFLGRPTGWS